jgi:hypothetical protein
MKAITWAPGTNKKMDVLFEDLRQRQYSDKSHRYWSNYGPDFYNFSIALTIHFNDENIPEMCSSIASRNCWPTGVYRILNRAWKNINRAPRTKISEGMALTVKSQISWLEENTDLKLYFISRQTEHWMFWVAEKFNQQYNLKFNISPTKYLTCPNECDESCWQYIIYNGNQKILDQWKSK